MPTHAPSLEASSLLHEKEDLDKLNARLESYIHLQRQRETSTNHASASRAIAPSAKRYARDLSSITSELSQQLNAAIAASETLRHEGNAHALDLQAANALIATLRAEIATARNVAASAQAENSDKTEQLRKATRSAADAQKRLAAAQSALSKVNKELKAQSAKLAASVDSERAARTDLAAADSDYQLLKTTTDERIAALSAELKQLSEAQLGMEDSIREDFVAQMQTIIADLNNKAVAKREAIIGEFRALYEQKLGAVCTSLESVTGERDAVEIKLQSSIAEHVADRARWEIAFATATGDEALRASGERLQALASEQLTGRPLAARERQRLLDQIDQLTRHAQAVEERLMEHEKGALFVRHQIDALHELLEEEDLRCGDISSPRSKRQRRRVV